MFTSLIANDHWDGPGWWAARAAIETVEKAQIAALVGKDAAGKRTVTLRDAQHVYVYTES